MRDDEKKRIQRAQCGDKEAIAALYDQHYEAIFNYLYYRVGHLSIAEDLTADVFLRMIDNLASYKDQGRPFLTWLYTIARNRVIDHYRKEDGKNPLPIKEERIAGSTGIPRQHVQDQEMSFCFTKALHHLTENQRRVIIHKIIDQRSTRETAKLLQKSEGAVRSLQYRALEALEKALREEKCL
ncbi:MAG: sigma-70 family RNA polymerase sigma factor [Anaerolineales bacterium]|nr:sigma-70 family RNA polymerase sigma factor [Anaerolineales bacterium]MBS3752250.1 sigma-70 family RNA polymerase sigma factor [Anaerolineales bacterium]